MNRQPSLPTTSPRYMSNICLEASEAASRASSVHSPACRPSPAALQLGGCRQTHAQGPPSSLAEEHIWGSFGRKEAFGVCMNLISLLGQQVGRGGSTKKLQTALFYIPDCLRGCCSSEGADPRAVHLLPGGRGPVGPQDADPTGPCVPQNPSPEQRWRSRGLHSPCSTWCCAGFRPPSTLGCSDPTSSAHWGSPRPSRTAARPLFPEAFL